MTTIMLTSRCNYNCKYCCQGADLNQPKVPELEPSVYVDFFKEYPNIEWNLLLLGGEPFLYKKLDELVTSLESIYHKLLMITNFSADISRYDTLIKIVEKRKQIKGDFIKYKCNFHNISTSSDVIILASLHPQIEEDREALYDFMYKISYLKEHSIDVIPTYVMHPSRLDRDKIFYLDDLFKKNLGIQLTYYSFFGRLDGKLYPESYSEEEKSLIRELPLSPCDEVYSFGNCYFGKNCSAGHDSFFIHQNGDIARCTGRFSAAYENILDKKLTLHDTPHPCGKRCTCYSGRYFNETALLG